jgi:hypothetical protein
MTPRERIVQTSRGGMVDRPAWFVWEPSAPAESLLNFSKRWSPDLLVAKNASEAQTLLSNLPEEGPAVLVEVSNPFLTAMASGVIVGQSFHQCPVRSDQELEKFTGQVREQIHEALHAGVDGVFYRLGGANPHHASPMEYQGLYFERDYALLSEISDARFNVLFVEGEEDPYLDLVHELPASALMWEDDEAWPPAKVREFHSGALVVKLWRDLSQEWERLEGTGVLFGARVVDMNVLDLKDMVDRIMSLKGGREE